MLHDSHIEALRDAALRFGAEVGVLGPVSREAATLWRVLGVLAEEWVPEGGPAEERFRRALLEFGGALGTFGCGCGEAGCPRHDPHALTAQDLLAVVGGEWHARAGCLFLCQHAVPVEKVERTEAVLVRNRARLAGFRERLAAVGADGWGTVAARGASLAATPLHREARAAARHAIEVWFPDRDPEADRVRAFIRALGGNGAEAAACALDALRVRGVLAPEMFDALYAPLEPVIPFDGLEAVPASAAPRWAGRH